MKKIRASLAFILSLFTVFCAEAETWSKARTSQTATGSLSWQYVVCENGAGWRSCNMPLNIVLTASPSSVTGYYSGSTESSSTITATVTDYFGNPVGNDVTLDWTTTSGSVSPLWNKTNTLGRASVTFSAPQAVGVSTIRATAREDGGTGTLTITLKDKWVNANSPTYTAWANSGGVYGCTNWSPSPSTINSGQTFTQTATDCEQNQTRARQERERSLVTGNLRNTGSPVIESRTLNASTSRSAVGTKSLVNPQAYSIQRYRKGHNDHCDATLNVLLTFPASQTGTYSFVNNDPYARFSRISPNQIFISSSVYYYPSVTGSLTSQTHLSGTSYPYRITVTYTDGGVSTSFVVNGSIGTNDYAGFCTG